MQIEKLIHSQNIIFYQDVYLRDTDKYAINDIFIFHFYLSKRMSSLVLINTIVIKHDCYGSKNENGASYFLDCSRNSICIRIIHTYFGMDPYWAYSSHTDCLRN